MSFLPGGYKIPEQAGKYMKFIKGDNQFRIMSSPIIGYEYWIEEDGKKKPIRKKMDEEIIISEVPEPEKVKHFWAMIVFDRSDGALKILEITQKSIMKSLKALVGDKDWGNPKGDKGYDVLITREGDGLETSYEVNPKPHKRLEEDVLDLYASTEINLVALFDGDDPFEVKE